MSGVCTPFKLNDVESSADLDVCMTAEVNH